MSSSFQHTLRSLEHEPRWGLWLAPGLLSLGGWLAWMCLSSVSVYASAHDARIEVKHPPSRVATELGGRVASLTVALGAKVQRGDALVELDGAVQRAALTEQLTALDALRAKRTGIEAQLRAERAKRTSRQRLGELAGGRASLGLERALAVVSHRETLAEIAQELQKEQLNTRIDLVNAEESLREGRIAQADASAEIARAVAEQEYQDRVDVARISELERQLIDLDAEGANRRSAIDSRRLQIERLCIRAPAGGQIGSVAPLQVGDVVEAGQLIATIIPSDDVRVVAFFPPGPAVGRIVPGQLARLRLDGFSFMEFGMLEAQVTQTASEPHEGAIRVELALTEADRGAIPMQHGLIGSVDVRIEQTTPWILFERSIGAAVTRAEPFRAAGAGAERGSR